MRRKILMWCTYTLQTDNKNIVSSIFFSLIKQTEASFSFVLPLNSWKFSETIGWMTLSFQLLSSYLFQIRSRWLWWPTVNRHPYKIRTIAPAILLLLNNHPHTPSYDFVRHSLITHSWARKKQSHNETYYMTDLLSCMHAKWRVLIGYLAMELVSVQTSNYCWENFQVNFKKKKPDSGQYPKD